MTAEYEQWLLAQEKLNNGKHLRKPPPPPLDDSDEPIIIDVLDNNVRQDSASTSAQANRTSSKRKAPSNEGNFESTSTQVKKSTLNQTPRLLEALNRPLDQVTVRFSNDVNAVS